MGLDVIDELFRFDLAEYYDEEDAPTMYQWTISSNCGGFTSYNKDISKYDGLTKRRIIKTFDVNSMYPFIMTGDLPHKDILSEKPTDGRAYTT